MSTKNKNITYIIIAISLILSLLITFFNYKFRNLTPDTNILVLYISTYLISPIFAGGIAFYSYKRIRIEKNKILKIGDIISIIIGVFILVLTFVSIFIKNENILHSVSALWIFLIISIFIEGIIRVIFLIKRRRTTN